MEQASSNPARIVRMILTMLKKFSRLAGGECNSGGLCPGDAAALVFDAGAARAELVAARLRRYADGLWLCATLCGDDNIRGSRKIEIFVGGFQIDLLLRRFCAVLCGRRRLRSAQSFRIFPGFL
jgi:hypothetical protein